MIFMKKIEEAATISAVKNSLLCPQVYMEQSIQECTKLNFWKTAFKKFEGIWSSDFLKAVFRKFYFVHS